MLFYWSRSIRADKKMFPSLLSKKVNCFCFSVVAQFPEDNVLYRGRLEALGDKGVDTGHRLLKVRFIDFGNVAEVEGFAIFENYDALDAIPPQAGSLIC